MIERDIILTNQSGCELRGAVDGAAKIVAPVYTHFDPDGRPVSLAFVISMLTGFVSREGLVNGMIVHSEMPSEKSSAIVTASEPPCSWRARDAMRRRYETYCRSNE